MSEYRLVPGGFVRFKKPLKYLPPIKSKYIGTRHTVDMSEIEGRQLRRTMHHYYSSGLQTTEHRQYCSLLTAISKSLTKDNVDDIKFLAKDHFHPKELLLDVHKPSQMLAALEGQHLLAENSLVFLQMLLYYIGRLDLYNMVVEFRRNRQRDLRQRGFDISDEYRVRHEDPEKLELVRELASFRRDLNLFPRKRNQKETRDFSIELRKLHAKMMGTANKIKDAQTIADALVKEKKDLRNLRMLQEVDDANKAFGVKDRLAPVKQDSMTKRIRRLRQNLGLEEVPMRQRHDRVPPIMLSVPDVSDPRLSRIVTVQRR
ncbi:uncharacterized protein [Ptychodera flava]|uniref:uncharacterized protein n=1 Tax=Ptychodera flava TaxID=63121 RepID=UPI00396AAB58